MAYGGSFFRQLFLVMALLPMLLGAPIQDSRIKIVQEAHGPLQRNVQRAQDSLQRTSQDTQDLHLKIRQETKNFLQGNIQDAQDLLQEARNSFQVTAQLIPTHFKELFPANSSLPGDTEEGRTRKRSLPDNAEEVSDDDDDDDDDDNDDTEVDPCKLAKKLRNLLRTYANLSELRVGRILRKFVPEAEQNISRPDASKRLIGRPDASKRLLCQHDVIRRVTNLHGQPDVSQRQTNLIGQPAASKIAPNSISQLKFNRSANSISQPNVVQMPTNSTSQPNVSQRPTNSISQSELSQWLTYMTSLFDVSQIPPNSISQPDVSERLTNSSSQPDVSIRSTNSSSTPGVSQRPENSINQHDITSISANSTSQSELSQWLTYMTGIFNVSKIPPNSISRPDVSQRLTNSSNQPDDSYIPTSPISQPDVSPRPTNSISSLDVSIRPTDSISQNDVSPWQIILTNSISQPNVSQRPNNSVSQPDVFQMPIHPISQPDVSQRQTNSTGQPGISQASTDSISLLGDSQSPTNSTSQAEFQRPTNSINQYDISPSLTNSTNKPDVSKQPSTLISQPGVPQTPTNSISQSNVSQSPTNMISQLDVSQKPTDSITKPNISQPLAGPISQPVVSERFTNSSTQLESQTPTNLISQPDSRDLLNRIPQTTLPVMQTNVHLSEEMNAVLHFDTININQSTVNNHYAKENITGESEMLRKLSSLVDEPLTNIEPHIVQSSTSTGVLSFPQSLGTANQLSKPHITVLTSGLEMLPLSPQIMTSSQPSNQRDIHPPAPVELHASLPTIIISQPVNQLEIHSSAPVAFPVFPSVDSFPQVVSQNQIIQLVYTTPSPILAGLTQPLPPQAPKFQPSIPQQYQGSNLPSEQQLYNKKQTLSQPQKPLAPDVPYTSQGPVLTSGYSKLPNKPNPAQTPSKIAYNKLPGIVKRHYYRLSSYSKNPLEQTSYIVQQPSEVTLNITDAFHFSPDFLETVYIPGETLQEVTQLNHREDKDVAKCNPCNRNYNQASQRFTDYQWRTPKCSGVAICSNNTGVSTGPNRCVRGVKDSTVCNPCGRILKRVIYKKKGASISPSVMSYEDIRIRGLTSYDDYANVYAFSDESPLSKLWDTWCGIQLPEGTDDQEIHRYY